MWQRFCEMTQFKHLTVLSAQQVLEKWQLLGLVIDLEGKDGILLTSISISPQLTPALGLVNSLAHSRGSEAQQQQIKPREGE